MPLATVTVDRHGVGILGISQPVPDKEKGHLGTRSLCYTEKQELLCQLILLPTTLFFCFASFIWILVTVKSANELDLLEALHFTTKENEKWLLSNLPKVIHGFGAKLDVQLS